VKPTQPCSTFPVINPATELPIHEIHMASAEDVDRAVQAARAASADWAETSPAERVGLLRRLAKEYKSRSKALADAMTLEMGAPTTMANHMQAAIGLKHIHHAADVAESFSFESAFCPPGANGVVGGTSGERSTLKTAQGTYILHMPIGVCGLITPWNWPMNQVTLKVAYALAAGCTTILKPSEFAPLSASVFAEAVHASGFPRGVFNLVHGDGLVAGSSLAAHPEVDMVSFTGSKAGGVAVSKAAADTVKRVSLELGGKGPNLIFQDVEDLERTVRAGVEEMMCNSGQSCNAPSRMLVQRTIYEEALRIAAAAVSDIKVQSPDFKGGHIGPVVNAKQFEHVQRLIYTGIEEGATLLVGGPGRPAGFEIGYYVRPTLFADVDNSSHTIAREEVFGPVLCIIPFDDEDDAVAIANDTPYGLTSYVQTSDPHRARRLARRLKAGMIEINGISHPAGAPFGGVKESGIGREGGIWGLAEYLEVKAASGWPSSFGESDVAGASPHKLKASPFASDPPSRMRDPSRTILASTADSTGDSSTRGENVSGSPPKSTKDKYNHLPRPTRPGGRLPGESWHQACDSLVESDDVRPGSPDKGPKKLFPYGPLSSIREP